jgi:outer membrane protein OmpA-like peptidoglycan-associated protein
MKKLIFIIITLIPKCLTSQYTSLNLIENPGFEQMDLTDVALSSVVWGHSYLTQSPQDFEKRCPAWLAPWSSKPALVDSASRSVISGKTYGKILYASNGRRFIELMVHGYRHAEMPAYRDYIGQKLKIPLKKGTVYRVELDLARSFWVAINKLGFFFSEKPVQADVIKDWKGDFIDPQVIFDSILCKIPTTWYRLSATFTLDKDAQYFYFGNFASINGYQKIFNSLNDACVQKNQAATYYVDNFSLVEVQTTATTTSSNVVVAMPLAKLNETIILRNVLFETNRAYLKATHLPELDGLYDRMFKNPSWTVLITGHTDNVGSVAGNQQLSENRANTIAEYLQNKGIDAQRIQKRGVGATQPIADNQTPEGREKNRRVEIEINQ